MAVGRPPPAQTPHERGSLLGRSPVSRGGWGRCKQAKDKLASTTARSMLLFAAGLACSVCVITLTATVVGLSHTTASLADFLTLSRTPPRSPWPTWKRAGLMSSTARYRRRGKPGMFIFSTFLILPSIGFLLTSLVAKGDGHDSVSHTQPSDVPVPMYFNLTEDRTSLMLFRKQMAIRASNPRDKILLRDGVSDVLISTLDVVKENGKDGATAKESKHLQGPSFMTISSSL